MGRSGGESLVAVGHGRDRHPERQRLDGNQSRRDERHCLPGERTSTPAHHDTTERDSGKHGGRRLGERRSDRSRSMRCVDPFDCTPSRHENDGDPDGHGEPVRPTKDRTLFDHVDGLRGGDGHTENQQHPSVRHLRPGTRHHARRPDKRSTDIRHSNAEADERKRKPSIAGSEERDQCEHPGNKTDGRDRQLGRQRPDPRVADGIRAPQRTQGECEQARDSRRGIVDRSDRRRVGP